MKCKSVAIGPSRERLRTRADGCATSREHTLNPQTPRVKREPLLRIREKHMQSVPPRTASSVHAFSESVVTLNEPRRNSCSKKMNHQSQIIQNQSKTRSPNQSHTLYLTQCSVKRFVALDTSIENRRQVGVANFDTTRYYQIDWASLPVVVVVAPSDLLFPAY